ncbi:hypothetical protein ACQJBY_003046 [Aegilops geniculata]
MMLTTIVAPSQQIKQLMENANLSLAEWRLSISTELQGYGIPGADRELQPKARTLCKFSQETAQLKPPWPSFSCKYRAVQVLSMSVRYLSVVQLRLSPSKKAFYAFHAQDVQLRFGFSQNIIQLKLPGPSFSCDICVLTSLGSSTSYSLCACSPDNKFQQRTSLNWELQLHLNQRPPLAHLGTVDSNTTSV